MAKAFCFCYSWNEKRKYFLWLALSKNKNILELPFEKLSFTLYLEKLNKKAFIQLEPPKKESRK
jgi:hypothetical protein